MRWPLRRRKRGGRLPSLGQDYDDAHRRYVERVGPSAELWLRTKPFRASPDHELRECLRTFAHIVERLDLGIRAQVLDVGCGPGWLSEFLARCGYWVTGIDVSEDMVEIARRRVAAIQEPIGEGVDALAEFHSMPVRELPWKKRFDAAILYDAMHHFDDEMETLKVIRRALVPGGRLFVHEGVRPAEGSEGERELIAEMEEYGTLESPFDPEYLVRVVGKAGFEPVTRFAAVDELLDVSERPRELRRIEAQLDNPPMNTVIAVNPAPVEAFANAAFHARIEAGGSWRRSRDGQQLARMITVTNSGRAFWPAGINGSIPVGTVTLGPYISTEAGERVEFPRIPLPRPLSPGESVDADVQVPLNGLLGKRELALDLVREGVAWFSDEGSPVLLIPLPEEE